VESVGNLNRLREGLSRCKSETGVAIASDDPHFSVLLQRCLHFVDSVGGKDLDRFVPNEIDHDAAVPGPAFLPAELINAQRRDRRSRELLEPLHPEQGIPADPVSTQLSYPGSVFRIAKMNQFEEDSIGSFGSTAVGSENGWEPLREDLSVATRVLTEELLGLDDQQRRPAGTRQIPRFPGVAAMDPAALTATDRTAGELAARFQPNHDMAGLDAHLEDAKRS